MTDDRIRVTQNFDYERPIGYASYNSETGKVEIEIRDPEIKHMLDNVDLKVFSLGWGYTIKPPAIKEKTGYTYPDDPDEQEAREQVADQNPPRLKSCVQNWPEAEEGGYNPYCCRFPKSCSADIYDEARVKDEDLEPFHRNHITLKRHRGPLMSCISPTCKKEAQEYGSRPEVTLSLDVTPRDTSDDPPWQWRDFAQKLIDESKQNPFIPDLPELGSPLTAEDGRKMREASGFLDDAMPYEQTLAQDETSDIEPAVEIDGEPGYPVLDDDPANWFETKQDDDSGKEDK